MSTHDRIVTRVYIDGRLALVQTVIGQVGRLSSVTANREKNTVLELPRDVLLADTFTIREPDRRTWYGRKVPGLVHQIRID